MSPSMGLREEKKRRTHREVLANAIALFEKQGIRDTRTSEIARLSGVSPGTLFNYFATKDALIEAWLRGELDATVRAAASDLGERGLRPMMRQVCRVLSEDCVEPRGLRAEGWRVLGRGRSADFRLALDSPLVQVVSAEQKRERVRKDIEPLALSEVLVDGLEGGLIGALVVLPRSEGQEEKVRSDPANIARAMQGRVELMLDGMRKRNERVPASAARRRAFVPPATHTQE